MPANHPLTPPLRESTDPDQSDPLICVVSDLHLGGDPGQEDFFATDEFIRLLDMIDQHDGRVELVIAGDWFDLLQIQSSIGADGSRVRPVVSEGETAQLFERLKQFAARSDRRVIYLIGNHDSQIWWDRQEQQVLRDGGYVSEIALGYHYQFGTPEHGALLYCDHGAEYDPGNAIRDYSNPLSTPLGHHFVLDFVNHLEPLGRTSPEHAPTSISDIDNIYPLEMAPWWFVSRFFYRAVEQFTKYVALPGLILYLLFHLLPIAFFLDRLVTNHPVLERLPSFNAMLWIMIAIFDSSVALGLLTLLLIRRSFRKARRNYGLEDIGAIIGRGERFWKTTTDSLTTGERCPAFWAGPWDGCDVLVYGHTHFGFIRPLETGERVRAIVNTGSWTRKVLPVRGRFRLPPVFLPTYHLSYALAYARDDALHVELWEIPKAINYLLPWPERLAIIHKERPISKPESIEPQLLDRIAISFHSQEPVDRSDEELVAASAFGPGAFSAPPEGQGNDGQAE